MLGILLVFTPTPAHAELTRVEVTSRVDVLGGRARDGGEPEHVVVHHGGIREA